MDFRRIRYLDNTGRICIPRDVRRFFHISTRTQLSIETTNEGILLRVTDATPSPTQEQEA